MTYALIVSLQVGDSMQLSSASRQMDELFRVIAIERDVDELGTPLSTLSHSRTIRIHARRENIRDRVVPSVFFATEGSRFQPPE
jgi:hypothetical protein